MLRGQARSICSTERTGCSLCIQRGTAQVEEVMVHTSKDRTIFSMLATGVLTCAEAHIPLYAWQIGSGSVPQSLMLGRTTPKAVKHCLIWHINQCSHHARRVAAVAHSQAQHNGRDGSQQLLQPPQLSHDGATQSQVLACLCAGQRLSRAVEGHSGCREEHHPLQQRRHQSGGVSGGDGRAGHEPPQSGELPIVACPQHYSRAC